MEIASNIQTKKFWAECSTQWPSAQYFRSIIEKDLLPTEHLVDTNYAEAKQFVQGRQQYGIDLIAPTRADHKWQGQAGF